MHGGSDNMDEPWEPGDERDPFLGMSREECLASIHDRYDYGTQETSSYRADILWLLAEVERSLSEAALLRGIVDGIEEALRDSKVYRIDGLSLVDQIRAALSELRRLEARAATPRREQWRSPASLEAERFRQQVAKWAGDDLGVSIVSGREGQVDVRMDEATWTRIKDALEQAKDRRPLVERVRELEKTVQSLQDRFE